jgi:hypothetical protein
MTTREILWWVPIEVEMPPPGMVVLADCADGRRRAWLVEGVWLDADREVELADVHHWAAMPTGARP